MAAEDLSRGLIRSSPPRLNGTVHWFTDFADMAAFEGGLVKTLTDPGYLAILAKAEDLFIEGTTKDTVIYMM